MRALDFAHVEGTESSNHRQRIHNRDGAPLAVHKASKKMNLSSLYLSPISIFSQGLDIPTDVNKHIMGLSMQSFIERY